LSQKACIAEERIRFREVFSQFFLSKAQQAEEFLKVLWILLFNHLEKLAVLGPASEQEKKQAMIDDINEIPCHRLIFGLFIQEVFRIKGGKGRGGAIESQQGGGDLEDRGLVTQFLNSRHIRSREGQGKLRSDSDPLFLAGLCPFGGIERRWMKEAQESQDLEERKFMPFPKQV
jgi:hypothetical protein